MATRFYLPSTGAAPVSPAFNAGWNDSASADRLALVTARINSAMTLKSRVGNVSANSNYLLRQYVSAPLAAQTVSGSVRGIARARESDIAADVSAQSFIYVVSGDGATVRGVLSTGWTGAIADEWTATLGTRRVPRASTVASPNALTSQAAQDGDRIVIEIGFRAANARSTGPTNEISFGDNSATDFASDTEGVTTANNPWIEFSVTLAFAVAPPASQRSKPASPQAVQRASTW